METNELIHLGSRKNIAPDSILMMKSDVNYTTIYLVDGYRILSSTTMGILEKRLKEFKFFRPNRSFIINLQFVADFENKVRTGAFSRILLKNNESVPLSRRRITAFLKIME